MVTDELRARQARPVDEVYPIVLVDGLRIRVRDGGRYQPGRAPGRRVDVDSLKHVLGI